MKKNTFLFAALLGLTVLVIACGNSGEANKTTQTDTATQLADTIKSDPTHFSDPH